MMDPSESTILGSASVVFSCGSRGGRKGQQGGNRYVVSVWLNDGYDVISDSVAAILDAKWKPADWSAVADEFARRLKNMPASGDGSWHRNSQRDRFSNWLPTALENARRGGELLAIYECPTLTEVRGRLTAVTERPTMGCASLDGCGPPSHFIPAATT